MQADKYDAMADALATSWLTEFDALDPREDTIDAVHALHVRIAALVRAEVEAAEKREREACAKGCDAFVAQWDALAESDDIDGEPACDWAWAAGHIAAAIRARGGANEAKEGR